MKLTRGQLEKPSMVSPHVHLGPFGPRNLLQLPLRAGRPPQIVEPADDPQHSRQSNSRGLSAETGVMRSESAMHIAVDGPVGLDRLWIREEGGFAVRPGESAENFVADFNRDRAPSVVDGGGDGAMTIGSRSSV